MAPQQAQAENLVRQIRDHKATIRRTREKLAQAKAALVALERECSQRGIRLILKGEGNTHGHDDERTTL